MRYRALGETGLRVSALVMGTHMNLGDQCDEAASREMVRVAVEGGINTFDTANAYADGAAETVLGRCLRDYPRDEVTVISKAGAPT